MKRISIAITSLLALSLASCLKDKPNTDFTGTQGTYIAEITTSSNNSTTNSPSSGLAYFAGASLNFAGLTGLDTVWFTVNIASDYAPKKDIPITLAVDAQALATYNAGGPPTVFTAWPDSTVTFATKTGTIKAGNRLDTFYVVFNTDIIDPTQSYMLPISITSAPGTTISGNMGTIYFHVVGNPIAGTYNQEWIRYNNAAGTGTPAYDEQVGPSSFVAVTPTEVTTTSGSGPTEIIDFDDNGGVLSNFRVSFIKTGNQTPGAPDAANINITITSGPTITVDQVAHKYTINYTYNNSSGAARNITDIFYK